ncbi:VOC family protein [Streptomyces griseocarneus]|uniref:VOC family protein n=1 Tax=Streptomyces griseocarneus TaxID=51201 RepID=UPI00167EE8DA|nr:VOC family protein [Streptomyces griseocarneus]MBZ6474332.1 VOC family protein [Streptomyces griseocarneus]
MITTDFRPGSPSWIDLGAPDVAATAGFYRAVFGWEFETAGADMADYGIFKLDGRTVGGLGRLTEEGARSAWMIYFNTPDARAAAEATERAGGRVRVAPVDADGEGMMAQLTDPLGGQFAVWQPGTSPGLEAVDAPGTLAWTELYTTDAAAAKAFYGSLFGWQTSDMQLPGGGTYALVTPAGCGEERMQGGIMELPGEHLTLTSGRPYWHPVFAVTDCDATVDRVRGNGGGLQMGPEDAEGVGRLAICLDPSGADFVVLAPASDAGGSGVGQG